MKEALRVRLAGAETRSGISRAYGGLSLNYQPGIDINTQDYAVLVLLIKYSMGTAETGNSIVIKVEFSLDKTVWYNETNGEPTLTLKTYTFAAVSPAGTFDYFKLEVPFTAMKYARVSVKETDVTTVLGYAQILYAVGS